jgi:DNA-binding PadR family transcriptional regulator
VEAAIVRILKKRKNMQKTDIARFIEETIKNFKPTFEQITKAFDKLESKKFIEINKTKGIISYL